MRPRRLAALLLAALAALAPPAAAQEGGAQTATLQPGQVKHPLPEQLAPGDAISYDWRVLSPEGAAVAFSTHIHVGPATVNLSEEVAGRGEGRIVADREGQYSVLWENVSNRTVVVEYRLVVERAGAAEAPAAGVAAVAVLLFAAARRWRR